MSHVGATLCVFLVADRLHSLGSGNFIKDFTKKEQWDRKINLYIKPPLHDDNMRGAK